MTSISRSSATRECATVTTPRTSSSGSNVSATTLSEPLSSCPATRISSTRPARRFDCSAIISSRSSWVCAGRSCSRSVIAAPCSEASGVRISCEIVATNCARRSSRRRSCVASRKAYTVSSSSATATTESQSSRPSMSIGTVSELEGPSPSPGRSATGTRAAIVAHPGIESSAFWPRTSLVRSPVIASAAWFQSRTTPWWSTTNTPSPRCASTRSASSRCWRDSRLRAIAGATAYAIATRAAIRPSPMPTTFQRTLFAAAVISERLRSVISAASARAGSRTATARVSIGPTRRSTVFRQRRRRAERKGLTAELESFPAQQAKLTAVRR